MINLILIVLAVTLIIYIICRSKDNDSWLDGFFDALIISDLIEFIGNLVSSIDWDGDGGGFSGGGASGGWDD